MQATEQELLVARIFFRAVLPVIKTMIEDDPKVGNKFKGVTADIQILAKNDPEDVAAYFKFTDGALEVVEGVSEKPAITLGFPSVAKMNAMFAGKPVIPKFKGIIRHFGLFLKFMGLLMGMKLLMPDAKPKTPAQAALKVKMTLYMVSTALSQLNKAGDPDMVKWTTKQPERVYQWSCEPGDIAAYLKIKAGKSKAGRGFYTRRKPFVHMKFDGVDNALAVLGNEVDMVQAMAQGRITVEGSPEYCAALGSFMVRIAGLVS